MIWNKALVTGGAGFIGSHITERIIQEGKEAVVLDNLNVGKQENIPKQAVFIHGDIQDKEALRKAMEGVDVVFHNAAFVSIRGSFEKLRENLLNNDLGTLNVLEAARDSNVKKVIFASSMAVYGEPKEIPVTENHSLKPISPYGYSKVAGEYACKVFEENHGLKTISLRYFNTYGMKQTPSDYVGVTTTFIKNSLNNLPMKIFGNGSQTRDFVWVEDVAKANILAANSDISNESINIASGTEISINQLANLIKSKIGGNIEYTQNVLGEISRIVADISKAKQLLNYSPVGNLREQITNIVNGLKNES